MNLDMVQYCFNPCFRQELEVPREDIKERKPNVVLGAEERTQENVFRSQGGFEANGKPRGNNPYNLAFNNGFSGLRILHLFTDGHTPSRLYELGQIGITGMVRDPAEWHAFIASSLVPGGQGDVKDLGGLEGVLKEHFIEVTHAEEENRIGHLGLYLKILLNHGGLFDPAPLTFHGTIIPAKGKITRAIEKIMGTEGVAPTLRFPRILPRYSCSEPPGLRLP